MSEMNKDINRRITQVIITLGIQVVLLFLFAGDWTWLWGWIFVGVSIVILLINLKWIPKEVIEERGRKKENVKTWDKVINGLNIAPAIGIYVVSGLDYRFGWTGEIPVSIQLFGIILMFSGSMLFTWSMVSNKFFSTMVRIQEERGHKVATEGPYKHVRHPGYVGFIMMSASTPLFLGSFYGLICSATSALLIIIRTSLEDKTLHKELEGYGNYSDEVRYKLIPYIW